jgi:hypothetical protein
MVSKRRMTVDHKPKKNMHPKGSISMTGPEKLLASAKKGNGAAKATPAKRVKHKRSVY